MSNADGSNQNQEVVVKTPMSNYIKGGFGLGCGCLIFLLLIFVFLPAACTVGTVGTVAAVGAAASPQSELPQANASRAVTSERPLNTPAPSTTPQPTTDDLPTSGTWYKILTVVRGEDSIPRYAGVTYIKVLITSLDPMNVIALDKAIRKKYGTGRQITTTYWTNEYIALNYTNPAGSLSKKAKVPFPNTNYYPDFMDISNFKPYDGAGNFLTYMPPTLYEENCNAAVEYTCDDDKVVDFVSQRVLFSSGVTNNFLYDVRTGEVVQPFANTVAQIVQAFVRFPKHPHYNCPISTFEKAQYGKTIINSQTLPNASEDQILSQIEARYGKQTILK